MENAGQLEALRLRGLLTPQGITNAPRGLLQNALPHQNAPAPASGMLGLLNTPEGRRFFMELHGLGYDQGVLYGAGSANYSIPTGRNSDLTLSAGVGGAYGRAGGQKVRELFAPNYNVQYRKAF